MTFRLRLNKMETQFIQKTRESYARITAKNVSYSQFVHMALEALMFKSGWIQKVDPKERTANERLFRKLVFSIGMRPWYEVKDGYVYVADPDTKLRKRIKPKGEFPLGPAWDDEDEAPA